MTTIKDYLGCPLPYTSTVTTHDLRIGDFVFTHGRTFELTEVYAGSVGVSRTAADADDVVGFRTRLIATHWQEMPEHWAQDWHIQGNARARWARVIVERWARVMSNKSEVLG